MKMESISASRIKSYIMCPFKYYMDHHIKEPQKKGFGAEQGSLCHEIFEEVGRARKNKIENPIILEQWIEVVLAAYRGQEAIWKLSPKALSRNKTCIDCDYHRDGLCRITNESVDKFEGCPKNEFEEAMKMIEMVIYDESPNNPLNKKIIGVEDKFVMYIQDGDDMIPVVGILDIATELDADTVEIYDYKTGNFTQTYAECKKDPQLLIYNLSARRKMPQYKNAIITIWYLKKSPISLSFSAKDEIGTENAIKHYWRTIRNDVSPVRRCDRRDGTVNFDYKCKYMCNPEACKRHHAELIKLGGIIKDNTQIVYEEKKKDV